MSSGEGTGSLRDRLRAALLVAALGTLVGLLLGVGVPAVRSGGPDEGVLPARGAPGVLYARPFPVRAGDDLGALGFEAELARRGYRARPDAELEVGEFWRGAGRIAVYRRGFPRPASLEPATRLELRVSRRGRVEGVRDAAGRPTPVFELEPERIGWLDVQTSAVRAPVRLEDLPPLLVQTVLVIEDRRFYDHAGLDFWRMGGALLANLRAGRFVQGGSTITQQLARTVHLGNERTLTRKLREAWLALQLESRLDKDAILEAYLNEIYLGQDGGRSIRGVRAASHHYFGRPLDELEVQQMALLVGLIQAPNLYSPFRNPERARARRDLVLDVLETEQVIDAETAALARGAPLRVSSSVPLTSAGYFNEAARRELRALLANMPEPPRSDLVLFTTLDSRLQRLAARAVDQGLESLEALRPDLRSEDAPLQAALLALDPLSGAVLAHVGGRSWEDSPFDRATRARRQPGSLFKPIVALTALAWEGASPSHTLASQLDDAPFELETTEGLWEPQNHDGEFRGRVTLREAVEQSLNVPMARLGMEVGADRVARTARRLGVESPLRNVPSLALGTSEVTLLEMTRAYAVLAARGLRAEPRWLEAVRPRDLARDDPVPEPERPAALRVFEPGEVWLVTSLLRGVVEVGTGRAVRALGVRVPVAGKTGSTNDYRDGWFVGYTPELVIGVWVGFDDGRSIGMSGSRAAIPIFGSFLRDAYPGEGPPFPVPPGVRTVAVDPESGQLASLLCPGGPEWFLSGTEPTRGCPRDDWLRRFGRSILRDLRR